MKPPIAPLGAAVLGGLAVLGVLAMPGAMLETLVTDSGLPSVIAAAEAPLGMTARIAVALGTGLFCASFAWLLLFVLLGGGDPAGEDVRPGSRFDDLPTPIVRRADAHPDAPPRPPLRAARDLGTPFLDVRASAEPEPSAPIADGEALTERPLPVDFDQPLAAFDPQAIPEIPLPAPLSLKPLRRAPVPAPAADREDFAIFDSTPPVRRPGPPPSLRPRPREDTAARPESEVSINALLDRLERGARRQGLSGGAENRAAPAHTPPPERGIEDALVTLRNLARRT